MLRLLVVDDDLDLLGLIGGWLTQAGHHARLCDAPVDALFALAASPYDVMVTDVLMPDMDGTQLAAKAIRLQPGLKIIAVSGGGPMTVHEALDIARGYGLDRVLAKPLQPDDLLVAIDQALGLA